MSMFFKWTDERLLDALRRQDRGETAAEIARALGTSRSSVCGTLKRLRDEYEASEALGVVRPGAGGRP